MDNLWKEIERSARTIFRIFFDSKLYIKKVENNSIDNFYGVDLHMDFHGHKKMSLLLEEDTVKSILKKLTGNDNLDTKKIAYDIIGEMASIIACGALADIPEKVFISNPEKTYDNKAIQSHVLTFSSNLGKFAITLQDV